ncbi:MAG: hypothetical protein JEZ08_19845 [Clostridiales bacterium]|nr:hypothetical protein [Clostridiales bacterium]
MKVVEVIKNYEKRYVCIDEETGEILDDAQGYGYKNKQKAYSAYNYKYGNGKKKQNEYQEFWKEHKDVAKFINRFYEMWFKEIYRGEVSDEDLIEEIEKEFNINISKALLKHYEYAFKTLKKKSNKSK